MYMFRGKGKDIKLSYLSIINWFCSLLKPNGTYRCSFLCQLVSCKEMSHWQTYSIFFLLYYQPKYSFLPGFILIIVTSLLILFNTCGLNYSHHSKANVVDGCFHSHGLVVPNAVISN